MRPFVVVIISYNNSFRDRRVGPMKGLQELGGLTGEISEISNEEEDVEIPLILEQRTYPAPRVWLKRVK
jgi:hypothetical protein